MATLILLGGKTLKNNWSETRDNLNIAKKYDYEGN